MEGVGVVIREVMKGNVKQHTVKKLSKKKNFISVSMRESFKKCPSVIPHLKELSFVITFFCTSGGGGEGESRTGRTGPIHP